MSSPIDVVDLVHADDAYMRAAIGRCESVNADGGGGANALGTCSGNLSKALRRKVADERGQSTVEAAFVLPVLMLLFLMMLQPAICLYDHIVMRGAAVEACRLLTTSTSDKSTNEDYIRRRLSAIPDIPIFHVHSTQCSYEIEMLGDETASEVSVRISNEIKPLPLLDIAMGLLNALNGSGNLEIEAQVSLPTQPDWAKSSPEGSTPQEWVSVL